MNNAGTVPDQNVCTALSSNVVTLSGNGREVEIGAFLSEEERKELFVELQARFNDYRSLT